MLRIRQCRKRSTCLPPEKLRKELVSGIIFYQCFKYLIIRLKWCKQPPQLNTTTWSGGQADPVGKTITRRIPVPETTDTIN